MKINAAVDDSISEDGDSITDRGDSPSDLVDRAIAAFSAGDDDGFVACMHPEVVIWSDPRLASEVVLNGRDQVAHWCREARAQWSDIRFARGELSDRGSGVYVELDVISEASDAGGAWRLPLAVFFRDGLIVEAVPKPDREAAIAALEAQRP